MDLQMELYEQSLRRRDAKIEASENTGILDS